MKNFPTWKFELLNKNINKRVYIWISGNSESFVGYVECVVEDNVRLRHGSVLKYICMDEIVCIKISEVE